MFCNKCGKEIPDDSIFCPFCGESTGKSEKPTPRAEDEVVKEVEKEVPMVKEEIKEAPVEKVVTKVPLGVNISIILAPVIFSYLGSLFSIIMGIIYMRDQNPHKKKVGKIWLGVGIGAAIIWTIIFQSFG